MKSQYVCSLFGTVKWVLILFVAFSFIFYGTVYQTDLQYMLMTITNVIVQNKSSTQSNSELVWSSDNSTKSNSKVVGINGTFLEDLRKMGVEPAELHSFKSPYIITPNLYDVYTNSSFYKQPGNRTKKIISWHLVRQKNPWFSQGNLKFDHCPYSECEIDEYGKKTAIADVVLFFCNALTNPPKSRPPGQLWMLGCYESPVHWNYPGGTYKVWKDAINLTLNYRLDSDMFAPYGLLSWRHRSLALKAEEYLAIARNKTKTAAWMVSNCRGDRLNFVKNMQKYIDIDIYGNCGQLKCPRSNPNVCMEKLNTTYKFYLSFENSHCKDYVTEKMFKLFSDQLYPHIIPVVKGGFDYDKHFPNMTFVNGNHFKTAKDLALYLKDLGKDEHRYARMLQEKHKLVESNIDPLNWCNFCKMLHTKNIGTHRDIKTSWSHSNICKKNNY